MQIIVHFDFIYQRASCRLLAARLLHLEQLLVPNHSNVCTAFTVQQMTLTLSHVKT